MLKNWGNSSLILALGLLLGCSGKPLEVDLAIVNGYIIDGTGASGFHGDVLVQDGRIIELLTNDKGRYTAKTTVDADGLVVTPGFIDVHAHGDPLTTPDFENFLGMGVTTIFLGQDGASPWIRDLRKYIQDDSIRCGVNVGYFAGHGTLRRGSGMEDVPGTQREIERLSDLVEDVMEYGCFGVSTGLEYLPGTYANATELDGLARAVGRYEGMIMSHLRSEDDSVLTRSLEELIKQGEHCRVHAAHLKSVYGKGAERAEAILQIFEDAHERGIQITADMYPYLASYTGLAIVFPPWAKTQEDFEYARISRNAELRRYLHDRVMSRNGPGATLFGNPPFRGQTLEQVALESNRPFVDVLMALGPESMSAAYFIMDEELQDRLFAAPFIVVGSDGSPTMHHPRGYGTFAKVLRRYVFEERLLPLEQAVNKMSGLSAEVTGLEQRGRIAAGMIADLNLIDTALVRDMASFEAPHTLARGFESVYVGGKLAYTSEQGVLGRYGRVLSKREE